MDTRPYFEHFLKKCFLTLEKLRTLRKNFQKNELEACKVAAQYAMSAALHNMWHMQVHHVACWPHQTLIWTSWGLEVHEKILLSRIT